MRIGIVIEVHDGEGPINTIKLCEQDLGEAHSISEVMDMLKRCNRFVGAMSKAKDDQTEIADDLGT